MNRSSGDGGPTVRFERVVTASVALLGVVLLSLAASVWLSALANDDPLYLEPQGSIRADLARAWIDTGAPEIQLDGRDELPADIQIAMLPRDASVVDWSVVPKDFAYPVMLNTVVTPFGSTALALISPLAALFAAAVVGRILLTLTGSTVAASSGFLVLSSSIVWWSASYGGVSYALLGVSFGLLAVWLLIEESKRPRTTRVPVRLLAAGLCIGIASGFHYTSTPWWGAVFFVGCVGARGFSKEVFVRFAIGGFGVLVGLAPVLAFNTFVYGGPTNTGYSEFATVLEAIGWTAPALGFSSSAFGSNLRTYLVRPEIVPIVMLAALSGPALRDIGVRVRWVHGAALAAGYAILVLVTGSATLWGTNRFRTNASFLRYSAPVFVLLVILAMLAIYRLSTFDRRLAFLPALFAVAFAAVNVVTVVQESEGWSDTRALIDQAGEERAMFRTTIPEDAIVITRRGDKALFGERTTLVAAYLRTFTDEEGTSSHLYDTFPETERLIDVVVRLQPRRVVLLNDSGWITPLQIDEIENALEQEGICLGNVGELVMTAQVCPAADVSS